MKMNEKLKSRQIDLINEMNDTLPKPLTVSPRPICFSRGIDEFII